MTIHSDASAPREPGLSEAPNEEALLEALSDAADGFEEVAWTRSSRTLMLWLMEHLPRLLASSDRIAALEAELFQLRRWSADASLAFDNNKAGRARTNVERIYKRLLNLTNSAPRPSRPEPLDASRPADGAET